MPQPDPRPTRREEREIVTVHIVAGSFEIDLTESLEQGLFDEEKAETSGEAMDEVVRLLEAGYALCMKKRSSANLPAPLVTISDPIGAVTYRREYA